MNLKEKCRYKVTEHVELPIEFLNSALSYQRKINKSFVYEKSKDEVFDEREVEEIKVSARQDGSYRICDGQHTVAILAMRGYKAARCEVRYGLSDKEESDWFTILNMKHRPQTQRRILISKILGTEDKNGMAHKFYEWVTYAGFEIDLDGSSPKGKYKINCPLFLFNIFKQHIKNNRLIDFYHALVALKFTFYGDPISLQKNFIDGFFKFYDTYTDSIKLERFRKIMNKTTPEKIKNDIENTRSYEDTNMRYARFFLDSYNKGLKQENRLNAGQLYM